MPRRGSRTGALGLGFEVLRSGSRLITCIGSCVFSMAWRLVNFLRFVLLYHCWSRLALCLHFLADWHVLSQPEIRAQAWWVGCRRYGSLAVAERILLLHSCTFHGTEARAPLRQRAPHLRGVGHRDPGLDQAAKALQLAFDSRAEKLS